MKELEITFIDCRGIDHTVFITVPALAPLDHVRDNLTATLSRMACRLGTVKVAPEIME